jgi:hypothetical protein
MNIFNMDTVTCSQCGLDAQWESWIDLPMLDYAEEIIKCGHCGHTDLLAEGYQAYKNHLERQEAEARGEGREEPLGLIYQAEINGGVQTATTAATDPNLGDATEFSRWWSSLPALD